MEKLILFFSIFIKAPLSIQMILILSVLWVLTFIYGTFSVLLFRFYFLLEIERKTGKNIALGVPYTLLSPQKRAMVVEGDMSLYIINRYRAYKKNGDKGLPATLTLGSLAFKKAGYTIDMMSKKSIIFSYLSWVNMTLSGIFMCTIVAIGSWPKWKFWG